MPACNDNSTIPTDSYDRGEMLTHWADNIIVPAYQTYADRLVDLDESLAIFKEDPTVVNLATMRAALHSAYTAWQRVSMYEIGPAEAVALRSNTNTYPTDVNSIEMALNGVDYNLTLVSTIDQQGFPALDYLLYQNDMDDTAITERLSDPEAVAYMEAVVDRLTTLGNDVLSQWLGTYRADFIAASGNSATSSVDLLVNDVIFYYEKHLRAGKVGIPAGVFSDGPLPDRVESLFNGEQSKEYLSTALVAFDSFLDGVSYDGTTNGLGLMDYIDYLDEIRGTDTRLSDMISDQLTSIRAAISPLDNNLARQVETDNLQMLNAYDNLQRLVPLLKIDMVQSMGVNIDFVDTDGD